MIYPCTRILYFVLCIVFAGLLAGLQPCRLVKVFGVILYV